MQSINVKEKNANWNEGQSKNWSHIKIVLNRLTDIINEKYIIEKTLLMETNIFWHQIDNIIWWKWRFEGKILIHFQNSSRGIRKNKSVPIMGDPMHIK